MEIYKAKQAPSTTLYIYMVSTQEVRYEMRYGWNRNSPLVFKKQRAVKTQPFILLSYQRIRQYF